MEYVRGITHWLCIPHLFIWTDEGYFLFIGFGCQKVAHNLAVVKLHKAGTRFVTWGEN